MKVGLRKPQSSILQIVNKLLEDKDPVLYPWIRRVRNMSIFPLNPWTL